MGDSDSIEEISVTQVKKDTNDDICEITEISSGKRPVQSTTAAKRSRPSANKTRQTAANKNTRKITNKKSSFGSSTSTGQPVLSIADLEAFRAANLLKQAQTVENDTTASPTSTAASLKTQKSASFSSSASSAKITNKKSAKKGTAKKTDSSNETISSAYENYLKRLSASNSLSQSADSTLPATTTASTIRSKSTSPTPTSSQKESATDINFIVHHENVKTSHSLPPESTLKSIFPLYCTDKIKFRFKGKIVSKFSSLKALKIQNDSILETWDCENNVSTNFEVAEETEEPKPDNPPIEKVYCTADCATVTHNSFLKLNISSNETFLVHFHMNEEFETLLKRINTICTERKLLEENTKFRIIVRNGEKIQKADLGDCIDVFV